MSWTKIKSGFKGFNSAFSAVLLVLLSLALSLLPCSPASAYTFSGAKKIPISGVQFTAPAIRANQLIYNGSNSSIQFDTVTTGVQSWTYTSLFFQLNFNQTIPANSLVSVSMSVSHSNPNDAPVCFSGDFGQQLVFCDISGDNQNYTITGLFFYTTAYSNLKLYSYTSNANITLGTPAISVGPVVASTVNEEGLSDAQLQGLITQIDYVVQNTDVTRNGVRQQLDDIATALDDISSSSDRQWQQDQQDRQDAETQSTESQSSADDATSDMEQATQSLTDTMGAFLATFSTPSGDCTIPINDLGPNGVLDLGNINLCSIPDEMHSTITLVLNLIGVLVSIVLAVHAFHTMTDIIGMFVGVDFSRYERHYGNAQVVSDWGTLDQYDDMIP